MRTARLHRRLMGAAIFAFAVASLTACAPPRSVDAYCRTMAEHREAYLEAAGSGGEGLGGLLSTAGAVGDLKLMWDELAEVAPEEIRADTEAIRDAWRQQEANAGAGDWLSSLSTALLNSGSMTRVDEYVRDNCDSSAG